MSICCSSLGLPHICHSPGTAPISFACGEEAESSQKSHARSACSGGPGVLCPGFTLCAATELPSRVSADPEASLCLAGSEISGCWRLDPLLLPLI